MSVVVAARPKVASATYRGSATTAQVAAATLTATGPTITGLASGDRMLTIVACQNSADTIATPTGWTLVHGPTDSSGAGANMRGYLYSRTATGGADDTPTWTKTGANGTWRVSAHAYSSSAGIDVSAASALAGAIDTAPICPTVTTTVAGCLVIRLTAVRQTATQTMASHTERHDGGSTSPGTALYEPAATSGIGATGTATATASTSTKWVTWTVALRPAT